MPIDCLMPAFHNFTSYQGGKIGLIDNVETLSMTLTQSVTQQLSYPTKAWGGRFCLPQDLALRNQIIDGPWGKYYRPMTSVGGLMDAWPLLLIAACISCILGWLYITILARCAGPLILGTMIMGTLLDLALGLFFFLAIFFDLDDSAYAELNPITSVYVGNQAKGYSVVLGVSLMVVGLVMACITWSSIAHIDEMIGLVAASCECLQKGCNLRIFPAIQSAAFFTIVIFLVFFGLPLVASLGDLDASEININGEGIPGLQRVWKKSTLQHLQGYYYVIGIFFVLEFYLQFTHYVVAYSVVDWYFTPVTETKVDQNGVVDKVMQGKGKKTEVRVAGLDANYGLRQGTVIETQGGKMLVVPVGKKGPGLGRHEQAMFKYDKGNVPCTSVCAACTTLLFNHLGSLAIGSPIIFIFRPFRMISQIVSAFLARIAEMSKGSGHSDDAHTASMKSCFNLLSACLDQIFGKYSKNAFTELVLTGTGGFLECAESSHQFMHASGGSIAYLHGAMMMYELFGGLSITLLASWVTMILQAKLPMFNDPAGSYYIEDKNVSSLACTVVAFAVAFAWMSMWTQISDTLLYCTAWNRRQEHLGEEAHLSHAATIEPVTKYCPQGIRSLLPPHELEAHFEHGLHAHGLGAQGAIMAAMDHGGGDGGPQYSKMVASTHVMATKIMG